MTRRHAATLLLLVILAGCASPSPSPSAGASHAATESSTPTPTTGPTATPTPTPEPPLSLALPAASDARRVRFSVTSSVPTSGTGRFTVRVTSLATTLIKEIVLRWPSPLDQLVFLAPFQPSSSRLGTALVQPWTKWVVGPGEMGEPAGTTSLGWGPLLPGASLTISLVATRRKPGPVSFDLQFLAGEAVLTTATGAPAETRVTIP
ncbi:MAG TPA: hypothetical protein VKQ71_10185 [Acidimicrobiales bacterium]|nr:hypothetical protein [Acidimicrobiales bacterium]